MVVLPLSRLPKDHDAQMSTPRASGAHDAAEAPNWARIASAATLIASGALLLTGRRRTGLLVAATGTALALLDQQETLSKWWAQLPGYIGDIQELLTQAEGAVEEFAAQREKLGNVLGR
jgi:hypothetical protein